MTITTQRTGHIPVRLLSALAIGTMLLFGASADQHDSPPDPWEQGHAVMVRVDNRRQPDTEVTVLEVELTDHRGRKRTRQLKRFTEHDGTRTSTLLFFTSPADVRGVGLLTIEETGTDSNQWLYMPALRRTRRIAGSGRQDSFMGTDFTYEDLETPDITRNRYRLLGEEDLNGQSCWVIESLPLDSDSRYRKRLSWIDQESLLAVRVDFFASQGDPVKRLTARGISHQSDYWSAETLRMEDLERGRHTTLRIEEQEFDGRLPANLFSVRTLEQGRIP